MPLTLPQAIRKLLIREPFYGLYLMSLNKYFDNSISTACVKLNGINTDLVINKEFWDSLSDEAELGLLQHELGHILFQHLTMWDDFPNKKHLNIAQDAEVNSYIDVLPPNPILAENYGLPSTMGTKFYYENIPEDKDDENDTLDSHDWQDFRNLSDSEKTLVQNQINHIAKQTAETVMKSNGHIPAGLQEYINGLFKQREAVFNWKGYFRRVVGNSIKSYIKSTRYRPSFRFKGQPGHVLKFKPKVLVAIDTSGSVSNNELQDFFTEVEYLYKSGVGVDVIEFDADIQKKFPYTGKKTEIEICGRGGTDVTTTYEYYINHKEYSTLVVFTDGYLGVDHLSRTRNVIWVITSDGYRQQYPGISIYIPKDKKE